jgi:putative transposase
MKRRAYPTDLSDEEWAMLAPIDSPRQARRTVPYHRHARSPERGFLPAAQWWGLAIAPPGVSHWPTVYGYFPQWRNIGLWEQIHTRLREQVRRQVGRAAQPSAAITDSQSVKTTDRGGEHGYGGGKKVNGRKRHLLVDTLGLVLKARVHAADIPDREGAHLLLAPLKEFAKLSGAPL